MQRDTYSDLAGIFGYPFYIYEENSIAARLTLLREIFPGFEVLYSVKTNPHPAILRFMAANGAGADAASANEVNAAFAAGFRQDMIFYSAPGKTDEQLDETFGKCPITADSYGELARLDALGARRESAMPVGLRINPDISLGMGEFPEVCPGVSMKFGEDEETLLPRKEFCNGLNHARPSGIHVFLRSQVRNAHSIAATLEAVFKIALRCRQELGWDIHFVNFGSGLGIPYGDGTPALDTGALRDAVGDMVGRYSGQLPGCRLLLESGRFLVGTAGTFVSRIVDIKESRGRTYCITPGGLSGFLRPSVMSLLNALPFPVQGPLEPLFSNEGAHEVRLPEKDSGALKTVTVCGNLCTALDVMAKDVELPSPEVGDIVAVNNAGAYSASLSPFAFASFPRPVELYRNCDGAVTTS